MHGDAKRLTDQLPVPGPQLLAASDQTARRISWFVFFLEYVLGKPAQRTGVGNDAGRTKMFELVVILVEYFRREAEAVEPANVSNKSLVAIAQTVRRFRVEMMTPEQSGPATLANTQRFEEVFHTAVAPTAFIWS